jgi:hypothetical protein
MKHSRLLAETLRQLRNLGLDPEVHNGGKHVHVFFVNAYGTPCRLTFSHSAGGHHSFRLYKNHRANLRRALGARREPTA